jgi:hypothetical protein
MMKLYLTNAEGVPRMHALKYLRDALRVIDPDAKVAQADELLTRLSRDGYAHMASGDPVTLARMADVLTEAGMVAYAVNEGDDAEAAERRWRSRAAKRAGLSPEDVFSVEAPGTPPLPVEADANAGPFSPAAYETALACMAICNGDPIRTALHASALARTTGDAVVYHEVVHILGHTFPWVVEPLRVNGIWPS